MFSIHYRMVNILAYFSSMEEKISGNVGLEKILMHIIFTNEWEKELIETFEKIFQGTIILQINVFSSFERKNKNTIKSEKGTIEQTQTIFKNFQL